MPSSGLSERQAEIYARIEDKGFVTLDALAEAFNVSMQTARRDVIALADAGLVERFHGGAGSRSRTVPPRLDHAQKRQHGVEAKRTIAAAAAALVPAGGHVYLDVGTTAEAAALAIAASGTALTVITNSVHAAVLFDPARHRVRVLPGVLTGSDGSLTGADTCEALGRLRLDVAFIACSGIEPDGLVMDFDAAKIAVKRTAMAVARHRVLLATREKFGRTAREEIARLDDFDHVLSEPPVARTA